MGKKKGLKKGAGPKVTFSDEQLQSLLQQLSVSDTNVLKHAEKQLASFTLHHACIGPLMTQVVGSQDTVVRTQAAIMLKRKISGHFGKFNPAEQAQLKAQLLQMITTEADKRTATSLAGAIASVAFASFANNGSWDELFGALMALHKDDNPVLRARNYNILAQLAEKIAEHLKPHVTTIAQMLVVGCNDSITEVKVEAMQAATNFIMSFNNDDVVMAFEPVLRPLFGVMQACLETNPEVVEEGLEVIQEAVAMEQPLANGHIDALVPFVVQIIQREGLEVSLRRAAGYTLGALLEHRPKLISKANMVPPILQAMTNMIAAIDPESNSKLFSMGSNEKEGILDEEEDDDEDYEEVEMARIPGWIVDSMALHIPAKFFTAPALEITASCMSSADARQRRAGCALLGLIAEGASDHLRTILAQVLPPLITSIQDGEVFVREVACFALGQISEHCQPEILTFNQKVLPVIFAALNDPHQQIQTTICWVLEMFCEYLQPETLKPFLPDLLEKLLGLMNNSTRNVKEMAITAISATANASEKEFVPYVQAVCGVLHPIIFLEEEKDETLRGRALECLSHISLAVGRKEFSPYFQESMNAAGKALKADSDTLSEYVLVFFTNTVKTMKGDFKPYIAEIMVHIEEILQVEEMMTYVDEDEDDEDGENNEEAGGDDDEYEDVEDDDDEEFFTCHPEDSGVVVSKKAALSCLGAFADAVTDDFHPYLQKSLQLVLERGCSSIYKNVQSEALDSLPYFVKAAAKLSGISDKPKLGQVVQPDPSLADFFNAVNRSVIIILLKIMKRTDTRNVAQAAIGSLACVLEDVGILALNYDITEPEKEDEEVFKGVMATTLMGLIIDFLQDKAVCQTTVEEEDADDDDESHDGTHDAITDLLGSLAKVLGVNFLPYFDQFFPLLLKHTRPTRAHTDRSMAIGCFGEVVRAIGPQSIKYAEALLPALQAGVADQMETVRRNSAFCIGHLVESTEKQLVPHFPHILQMLAPLCVRSNADQKNVDDGGADIDNALSAVCRMIKAAPEAVPMPQVLPVIVAALPLQADHEEGDNIYEVLIDLIKAGEATAMASFNNLIAIFGAVLVASSKASPETMGVVASAVQGMANSGAHVALLQAAIAAVADDQAKAALASAAAGTLVLPDKTEE